MASIFGLSGAILQGTYAITKAGVVSMTQTLAHELGPSGIRVNAIGPSAVMTEGTSEFFGDRLEKVAGVIADQQTLKRNLQPEDLSGTVLYLASDASKFVTGQTLMVDGGTVFL